MDDAKKAVDGLWRQERGPVWERGKARPPTAESVEVRLEDSSDAQGAC